jgi:cardiolipin-specific phospholipase
MPQLLVSRLSVDADARTSPQKVQTEKADHLSYLNNRIRKLILMATTAPPARFPLPYSASFSQWWATTGQSSLTVQQQILAVTPFFGAPDYRTASQQFFPLSGKSRFLNEIHIRPSARADAAAAPRENNIVMLHGYGAGLAFYFRNFEGLTKSLINRYDFFALDWLGMGLSSRPAFRVRAKDAPGKIAEAESFFLDSLEEWREARKLEKMTLVAHSLGGYLAVRYANKYPERVEKLVLVSPVGVPKNPYEKKTEPGPILNTDKPDSNLANEFQPIDEKVPKQPLPRWVTTLWDMNFSPFLFVRWAGPFGPKLVSGWTGRRFAHISPEQQSLLHDYAYEVFKRKGSGEYALAYLLAPGAYARSPLMQVLPTKMPVLMLYGDRDWMDESAGREAAKIANSKGGDVEVRQISDAGHHCYLDNPEDFNEVVEKFVI